MQDLIKVDKSTIYRMAETGRLPAIKVGRQWRFPADRLYDWLDHRGLQWAPSTAGLRDLIPSESMEALTSLFGETLGVMMVVTDMAGRPLTDVGNPCGLFAAAHRHPGVLERCIAGWRDMADDPDLEPQWKPSPLGFLCARTLVRVGAQLKGMVMVGGLAPEDWPPEPAEVERLAAELEVPTDLLSEHIGEVHCLDPHEQERLLRLLPRLGAFLSRLAADSESMTGASNGPPDQPGQRSDQ